MIRFEQRRTPRDFVGGDCCANLTTTVQNLTHLQQLSKAKCPNCVRLPIVSPSWIWYIILVLLVVFALLADGFVQWHIAKMNLFEALKV